MTSVQVLWADCNGCPDFERRKDWADKAAEDIHDVVHRTGFYDICGNPADRGAWIAAAAATIRKHDPRGETP
jgi:hypothetical protein